VFWRQLEIAQALAAAKNPDATPDGDWTIQAQIRADRCASFPSAALPGGPGAAGINSLGDWVVCYGRSASVGTRALFTNTHRFD
jgi:hypothetical protein